MEKMSVHDILLKQRGWTDSSKLVKLVSSSWNISDRQAYRLVKKANDSKEIEKFIYLSNGRVSYGLTEWGSPSIGGSPRPEPEVDPAERHLQWRGTPEGGDNRYFKFMFPEKEKQDSKKD